MLNYLCFHVPQSPSSLNPQQTLMPRVGDGGTTGGAWCSSSPGFKEVAVRRQAVGIGVLNGPLKCLKAHASREAMGMINLFFLHMLVGFSKFSFSRIAGVQIDAADVSLLLVKHLHCKSFIDLSQTLMGCVGYVCYI